VLYHLLVPLASTTGLQRLPLPHLPRRGAVVTAFLVAFWFGPAIIGRLRMLKLGQIVRTEGPQTHLGKRGTPTMGGVMIVLSTVIPTLLWARLDNPYTIIALVTLLWLGALGFMDDYLKITRKGTDGLKGRYKILGRARWAAAWAPCSSGSRSATCRPRGRRSPSSRASTWSSSGRSTSCS
jgi:phospho-N-acetylmuramoyl-pentapeptide-transferase